MTDVQQQHETSQVDRLMELHIEAVKYLNSIVMAQSETIRELQQKLLDATASDRRPEHHGYTFHTYNSADAAFIRSYLNRKREERSYEFS